VRVYVKNYGRLPASRTVLVAGRRLHPAAATSLTKMLDAIERDLGERPKLASGWRPHRWRSREHYEKVLIERYGSVAEGRRWLAYDSPHETGLAVDFGSMGLRPARATVAAQRKTPLYQWLVEHAAEFGWYPYKLEPWHWECPVPLAVWEEL